MEKKICKSCGIEFEINDDDIAYYKKYDFPFPTLCPDDRERRRLAWRTERHLYKRICGLCGKNMISMYSDTCPFPVYCEQCFWSDKWNSFSYGRDFDFNKPFFEQFYDLYKVVPRLAINHVNCVNSDYSLNCFYNKNCYLISGGDYNEDCLYGMNTQRSKNCVDTYLLFDCELCYSCIDCVKTYNCVWCQECENVNDSYFLYDCKNCNKCALSSNLRNKQYVLNNQQLSKEEYEKMSSGKIQESLLKNVLKNAIHRHALIINSENVLGNYIKDSKNSFYVFDAEKLQDCKYIYYGLDLKDSYDGSCVGFKSSLIYECMSAAECYNCAFSNFTVNSSNILYSIISINCSDLFGCISMKNHQKYAILNKQYSKEEYEVLRKKIIEHMKLSKEWGEFFPPYMAHYKYNKSAANDYMPLTKEDALSKGFLWEDKEEIVKPASELEGIANCLSCKRDFKIIPQETEFYKKMNLNLPKLCWGCRVQKLISMRKGRKLFENNCKKCGMAVLSPISKEVPYTVYCEKCYLETVY